MRTWAPIADVRRPRSIDGDRMLIVGYGFGIRSEQPVRGRSILIWPIAGSVDWGSTATSPIIPRSPRTGSRCASDLLRKLFETVVTTLHEGRDRGRRSLRDASIIVADIDGEASPRSKTSFDFEPRDRQDICRSSMMRPSAGRRRSGKVSPADPAARYTASANSVAGYAYSDNYLVDLKHAVIVDVEATTTYFVKRKLAPSKACSTERLKSSTSPSRLVADGGYVADMVGGAGGRADRTTEPEIVIRAH